MTLFRENVRLQRSVLRATFFALFLPKQNPRSKKHKKEPGFARKANYFSLPVPDAPLLTTFSSLSHGTHGTAVHRKRSLNGERPRFYSYMAFQNQINQVTLFRENVGLTLYRFYHRHSATISNRKQSRPTKEKQKNEDRNARKSELSDVKSLFPAGAGCTFVDQVVLIVTLDCWAPRMSAERRKGK